MLSLAKSITDFLRASAPVRRTLIIAWHVVGICICYWTSFILRFDGFVPPQTELIMWNTFIPLLLNSLVVFALFQQFSGLWSYFSVTDLARMATAIFCSVGLFAVSFFATNHWSFEGMPRSIFVLYFLLIGTWMSGGRFAARYLRHRYGSLDTAAHDSEEKILIVGGLDEADLLLRAMPFSAMSTVVGIVTPDSTQQGLTLHGIPILSAAESIGTAAHRRHADSIVILPPMNRPRQLQDIVDDCRAQRCVCKFRMVPSIAELASGKLDASSIRNVEIDDLLSRDTNRLDRQEVRRYIKNKTVMVTGAGGSIGAEICRQIATYEPARLLLFEFSEYALYEIERELQQKFPSLQLIAYAGDIRHPEEVHAAIDAADGVDVIYHAAAYKHVPLMEKNIPAAFRTNVLGTARLAEVAVQRKVDRFVQISSDKAVRPTSIMGATKRIAERVIQELHSNGTTFVSVRFGNVLGSSGSVIPLFKEQIARGGPVTVTTDRMERYFMTIPEAVDLVLLAGTVGRNGDIMVLDMGEPVKIVDLARKLIELSGLVPDEDIRIEFTGLRPGEKEFEEVMTADENVVPTDHEKIYVFRKKEDRLQDAGSTMQDVLGQILGLVEQHDGAGLRQMAAELIPENMF